MEIESSVETWVVLCSVFDKLLVITANVLASMRVRLAARVESVVNGLETC